MTYEIAVAGRILSRYDCKTIRQLRNRKPFLKVHKSLIVKAVYGPLPFELLHTERVLRVYVCYYQGKTVQLTVVGLHTDQNDHTDLYRRTCHRLEIRSQDPVLGRPDDRTCLSDKSAGITLGQFEIAVASGTGLDGTHLCLEPELRREKRFHPHLHPCLQLKKINKFFFHTLFIEAQQI